MRTSTAAFSLTLFATVQVFAQDKVWTPAPVPSVGSGDTIQPAARAGQSLSNDGSTPFSSIPTGSIAAGGATSSNTTDSVDTPNLSK